jgi:hypothetical protein
MFGWIGDLVQRHKEINGLFKKTTNTALLLSLKQSFTKKLYSENRNSATLRLLDFKNFESLVFGIRLLKHKINSMAKMEEYEAF